MSTRTIEDTFGDQKGVALSPIARIAQPVRYAGLRSAIDDLLT